MIKEIMNEECKRGLRNGYPRMNLMELEIGKRLGSLELNVLVALSKGWLLMEEL
jgi:hypothetical protein